MRWIDTLRFCTHTLLGQRFKSLMLFLSISIGVISVVLLTGLGEGGRMFVLGEFSALGNDTLVMVPGRKQTEGGLPPLTGESAKPITLADARQISLLPTVFEAAPLVVGSAQVSLKASADKATNKHVSKLEVLVAGSTQELSNIVNLTLSHGSNLPPRAWDVALPNVQIGWELKQQLFANQNALGQWLKLNNRRYQISGVIRSSGSNLGMNFNKMILMPIHSAQTLFNQDDLFRVFFKVKHRSQIERAKKQAIDLMNRRQNGVADITIISQNAMLASFDNIMLSLNFAVAGIGVISLFVAGILIMNVTLISVNQRLKEIGLLRAIGSSQAQVRTLFLTEAGLVALFGTLIGLAISLILLFLLRLQFPGVPFDAPLWSVVSAVTLALVCALAFAWLPASKAAKLSIINALNGHQQESNG